MSDSDNPTVEGVDEDHGNATDLAGGVRDLTTEGWPSGYVYKATRYADVVLKSAFPNRCQDLINALGQFKPTLTELRQSGGGRTVFVKRFDDSLAAMMEYVRHRNGDDFEYVEHTIWGKQNVTIYKELSLDGKGIRKSRTRGHEIDMYGKGSLSDPIPGIAVEMEWNNKDPFFDRDLINFQALHREGAIAVGVIVTRGPALQELIGPTVRSKDNGFKYGQSSTHWAKLIPKVNLGGGGECPLLLVGIEPDRIDGVDLARRVKDLLDQADAFKRDWRKSFPKWKDAKPHHGSLLNEAWNLMPPLNDVEVAQTDDAEQPQSEGSESED